MEFGRFGMEGLGKEFDEGIYGAYPQPKQNGSFVDSLGEEYQRWAISSKEVQEEDLKTVDDNIEKLFSDCYGEYISNDSNKKKQIYERILFWERVCKDVSFGVPLSVSIKLEESHNNIILKAEDIARYDKIMEVFVKTVKERYDLLRKQKVAFSLENKIILRELEDEENKLLQDYSKALQTGNLEEKLRLMHELKKLMSKKCISMQVEV